MIHARHVEKFVTHSRSRPQWATQKHHRSPRVYQVNSRKKKHDGPVCIRGMKYFSKSEHFLPCFRLIAQTLQVNLFRRDPLHDIGGGFLDAARFQCYASEDEERLSERFLEGSVTLRVRINRRIWTTAKCRFFPMGPLKVFFCFSRVY